MKVLKHPTFVAFVNKWTVRGVISGFTFACLFGLLGLFFQLFGENESAQFFLVLYLIAVSIFIFSYLMGGYFYTETENENENENENETETEKTN